MPRFTGVEFGFENEHKAERISAVPKSASEPLSARSVPASWWLDTQAMPRYRKEARDGTKFVGLGLIAIFLAMYIAISYGMGWGPFR